MCEKCICNGALLNKVHSDVLDCPEVEGHIVMTALTTMQRFLAFIDLSVWLCVVCVWQGQRQRLLCYHASGLFIYFPLSPSHCVLELTKIISIWVSISVIKIYCWNTFHCLYSFGATIVSYHCVRITVVII